MNKKILTGFLTTFISSILWTFSLLYSQNALIHNRNWTSYHLSSFGQSTDGAEQMLARNILAGYELHGGYSGSRTHIITTKNFLPKKIEAEVMMGPLTQLSIGVVNKEGSTGVRYSSGPLIPSQYYQTDKNEEIIRDTLFPGRAPVGESTFTIEDGKEISFPEGKIFVNLYNGTLRSISINGERIPLKAELPILIFFLPLFIALIPVAIYLPRISVLVMYMGLLWSSFDFFFYSKKRLLYNSPRAEFETRVEDSSINFETSRGRFFENWFRLFGGETKRLDTLRKTRGMFKSFGPFRRCEEAGCRKLSPDNFTILQNDPSELKVLVIGGSLVGGWGTTALNDYYPYYLREKLAKDLRKKVSVVSISGFLPAVIDLTPVKLKLLIEMYQPELVLFEIHSATTDVSLMEAVSDKNLIFFRAPLDLPSMNPGKNDFTYQRDEEVLPAIKKMGRPFLDPNLFFHSPEAYLHGHYFIDDYHLSKAGHRALGKFLGEELGRELRVKKTSTR